MEQRWTPRLNTTQSGQAPQGRECPPTLTYSCYSHLPLLTTDHPTVHTLRSHPFSLPTASAVFPETVRHTLGKGDRIVVKGLPLPIVRVVPEGVVLAVIVAPAAQVAPPSTTTGYSTPAAMEVVRLEAALEAALEATELARLQELKGQLAAAKGVLAQQEAAMEAAWAGQQQQQQQDHPQQQYGRDGFASNPLPDDGNVEGDEEPLPITLPPTLPAVSAVSAVPAVPAVPAMRHRGAGYDPYAAYGAGDLGPPVSPGMVEHRRLVAARVSTQLGRQAVGATAAQAAAAQAKAKAAQVVSAQSSWATATQAKAQGAALKAQLSLKAQLAAAPAAKKTKVRRVVCVCMCVSVCVSVCL